MKTLVPATVIVDVLRYPKKVGHVAKRSDHKAIRRVWNSQRQVDITTRPRGGARSRIQGVARAAMVQAQEAALLLSVAATVPLRLARRCGDRTQCVAAPTGGRNACSASRALGARVRWGHVELEVGRPSPGGPGPDRGRHGHAPVGNSVEKLADQLVAHVETTLCRTGAAKVHLVGHSLGGVIIAQAIADPRLNGRVDTVITLGSPFGGSPWAGLLPLIELVRALRTGSPVLRRLASTPLPEGVRWLSVTAALDIVVPGVRSVPPHAQAQTITIDGVGHLGMLLSRRVIGFIAAALCAQGAASAG